MINSRLYYKKKNYLCMSDDSYAKCSKVFKK